tara:strand:+ start:1321 stop:1542 length:222 start_codon:yes stop_codon:yes gene_type:complete
MFKTNDLGTAAFLMLKGSILRDAYINDRKIFVFEFDGDEAKNRQIAIEYLNSECSKFDAQVKNLKKVLNSGYK